MSQGNPSRKELDKICVSSHKRVGVKSEMKDFKHLTYIKSNVFIHNLSRRSICTHEDGCKTIRRLEGRKKREWSSGTKGTTFRDKISCLYNFYTQFDK